MIIIQTPLRISLFGGGTDFPSFFLKEGGCVLSTSIDKYIFVTIKKRFDDKLRVGYTSTEMVDNVSEIKHELIREAFKLAGISKGVEVNTTGDIPAGTGLGSSSTVTVGVLHAMFTYLNIPVHPEQLAQLACKIEIETLHKPIGYQDQYIAAYGGFRLIEFGKDGNTNTQVIKLNGESENQLSDNLLLFYTGVRRQAESILAEQKQNIVNSSSILKSLKQMAYSAVEELQKGDIDCIGHMLHESWQLKKQLAKGISNSTINKYYERAMKAGALGGKLTGAGGGGFLLVYAPQEKRSAIRESLQELREVPINLEPSGSKVIFDYRRS